MALVTQIIDVPLTAGVDSKTTDFTASPPGTAQFSTISNMRSDYRAGFIPRIGYTLTTTNPSVVSPAWVASSPKATFYNYGRVISGDLGVAAAMAAPGTAKRRAFGSQLDTDPIGISCASYNSQVLTAWAYTAATAGPALAYQWYTPATDTLGLSGSITTVYTSIQVTGGPDAGYI